MKKTILSFLLFCFCVSFVSAQQKQINATALKSGCRILKSAPSYYVSDIHTSKIDEWTVQALLDETKTLGWCSSQNAQFPFTFVFELSEEFDLAKLVFFNEGQKSYPGICAKQVKVEVSSTASDRGYTDAGIFMLGEYTSSEFTINAPKTRWLRLTILSNYGHRQFTELMDFKAFGTYTHPEYDVTNIVGMWDTNFDWVSINNNDNGYIYGCYKWSTGTLSAGTVERRTFFFRWSQVDDGLKGWVTLVLNKEGTHLSGIWGYNNDYSSFAFWDFEKRSNTPYQCWNTREFKDKKPTYPLKSSPPVVEDKPAETIVKIKLVDAETNIPVNGKVILTGDRIKIATGNTINGMYQKELNEEYQSFSVTAEVNGYMHASAPAHQVSANGAEIILKLHKLEPGKAVIMQNIHFAQSKYELLPESFPELDKIVDMLNQYPAMEIELAGHTDNQGDADKNVELSESRVMAVKNYLIKKGIPAKRITGIGYGGSKPIASNAQEETRRLNRRVEFKIIKM